jgi:hypothetical protein
MVRLFASPLALRPHTSFDGLAPREFLNLSSMDHSLNSASF